MRDDALREALNLRLARFIGAQVTDELKAEMKREIETFERDLQRLEDLCPHCEPVQ